MKKLFSGAALLLCGIFFFAGCNNQKSIIQSLPGFSSMSNYTWMSLYLPWRVETFIPGLNGWYSKQHKTPPVTLTPETPYITYIALGSNAYHSYAVVRIDSKGNVTAAYRDSSSLRYLEKTFNLNESQTKAFTQILSDNRAGSFAASYVDTKTQDGTQGGFTLATKDGKRRTFLSNAWPGNFRDICEYVCDEILKFDPTKSNYGYIPKSRTIIQTDPEATLAVRGLLDN